MTIGDDIALAFCLLSLIAVFIIVRRDHKRNLPREDDEAC